MEGVDVLGAIGLIVHSGTTSRLAQNFAISEAGARGWTVAAIDLE